MFTQWPKCFGQSSCNFEGHGGQSDGTGANGKSLVLKVGVLDNQHMWFQRLFYLLKWGKFCLI